MSGPFEPPAPPAPAARRPLTSRCYVGPGERKKRLRRAALVPRRSRLRPETDDYRPGPSQAGAFDCIPGLGVVTNLKFETTSRFFLLKFKMASAKLVPSLSQAGGLEQWTALPSGCPTVKPTATLESFGNMLESFG